MIMKQEEELICPFKNSDRHLVSLSFVQGQNVSSEQKYDEEEKDKNVEKN